MRYANPTSLRIGAKGAFHGWRVTVTARLVLGVEIDGETYYWNEFYLIGDSGNAGTLVYEEAEQGPEWKLFREFEPVRPMSAAEAATKRVGDTVNLDGTPTPITLVDESRVYHIEGEPPEGVQLGDVARYFNADTGRRMLVASWTGDEIEFYEGEDVPAELVRQAFGLSSAQVRLTPDANRGGDTSPASNTRHAKLAVVILFIVALGVAIAWGTCSRRPAAGARSTPPPQVVQLPLGAQGRLGLDVYRIGGSATFEIARISGRQQRREYELSHDGTEPHFLVPGLTGQPKEWHLLRPVYPATPLDPYVAAAQRKGTHVKVAGQPVQIAELFRATVLSKDGAADGLPQPGAVRYGFVARTASDFIVARWDEHGVQLHTALTYAESDVIAAFGGAARAAQKK